MNIGAIQVDLDETDGGIPIPDVLGLKEEFRLEKIVVQASRSFEENDVRVIPYPPSVEGEHPTIAFHMPHRALLQMCREILTHFDPSQLDQILEFVQKLQEPNPKG